MRDPGTFHMSTEMTCYYPSLTPAILLCCYTAILHHFAILIFFTIHHSQCESHSCFTTMPYYSSATLLYYTTMPHYVIFFTIFQPPFPYPDHSSSREIIQPGLNLSLQTFENYINFKLSVQFGKVF